MYLLFFSQIKRLWKLYKTDNFNIKSLFLNYKAQSHLIESNKISENKILSLQQQLESLRLEKTRLEETTEVMSRLIRKGLSSEKLRSWILRRN